MDLSLPPEDAHEAHNYLELYERLKALYTALGNGKFKPAEFQAWDIEVKALLRADELSRYEKPLRPHIPLDEGTIQYARNFHLTKILWARKGLEKFMTDTGF